MTRYEHLLVQEHGPFITVTMNRPNHLNALTFPMIEELIQVFNSLHARPDLRALVITGAGEHFSGGIDPAELASNVSLDDETRRAQVARLDALIQALAAVPQVVVARVRGTVMGGGLGMVCVSDIAISTMDATFALTEPRHGLAAAIMVPYLAQRVGVTRARVMLLSAAQFDGVSAHEYQLVHEVCPAEILDECIQAVLTDIGRCSGESLRLLKRLILLSTSSAPADTLDARLDGLLALSRSAEGLEGVMALLQKRIPNWVSQP
jgi:isohexenylglutaconyl-CoA hydratase